MGSGCYFLLPQGVWWQTSVRTPSCETVPAGGRRSRHCPTLGPAHCVWGPPSVNTMNQCLWNHFHWKQQWKFPWKSLVVSKNWELPNLLAQPSCMPLHGENRGATMRPYPFFILVVFRFFRSKTIQLEAFDPPGKIALVMPSTLCPVCSLDCNVHHTAPIRHTQHLLVCKERVWQGKPCQRRDWHSLVRSFPKPVCKLARVLLDQCMHTPHGAWQCLCLVAHVWKVFVRWCHGLSWDYPCLLSIIFTNLLMCFTPNCLIGLFKCNFDLIKLQTPGKGSLWSSNRSQITTVGLLGGHVSVSFAVCCLMSMDLLYHCLNPYHPCALQVEASTSTTYSSYGTPYLLIRLCQLHPLGWKDCWTGG